MKREDRKKFIIENYRLDRITPAGREVYKHRKHGWYQKYLYFPKLDSWSSVPGRNSDAAFGKKIEAKWLIATLRAMAFPNGVKKT